MTSPIVEQYWGGVARRLQAEVDVFNRLIGHAGEQGRENELALVRLLEGLLPQRLGVGTGVLIDSENRRSNQTDVILYDPSLQPTLMAQVNQLIYPVEVAPIVIEVKTTLTADDLEDFARKRESISALVPSTGYDQPKMALFAYFAWAAPATLREHIESMTAETRPDLICIVSPGVVGGETSDGGYSVDFVPLHQVSADGARVSRSWRVHSRPPTAGAEIFEGVAYPTTRLPGTGWVVGEPGRALLLFSERVLQLAASRLSLPRPVISAYLNGISREVFQ